MISGFNTDVRHGERTFHVQTEDKGLSNPLIESLVYVGGQVLAAKRTSYAKLLEEGKGSKEISQLMETQHRTMLVSIRQGKLDSKAEALLGKHDTAVGEIPGVTPPTAEPETPPSPEAFEDLLGVTRAAEPERTLDQVILDYLTSEAEQEHLRLAVDGDPDLSAGASSLVRLRATSSKSGHPVHGARVAVKLISTITETQTLASGETSNDGGVDLAIQIPAPGVGSAALIFTADSEIGSAELKHLL